MHDKVALWEEKQNGFEILMRYNMIQGPLRNRREGLHAAESMQTSNEKPYALILFISPNIPETITHFTAAGAGHGNTLLYEEQ